MPHSKWAYIPMETGETDGIEIRKRDRRKRIKRLPLLCVICSIMMTHSVCVDSLQKGGSWGKADVAQASLLVDQLDQPLNNNNNNNNNK